MISDNDDALTLVRARLEFEFDGFILPFKLQVEAISEIDPLRGGVERKMDRAVVFAGSHYASPADTTARDNRAR